MKKTVRDIEVKGKRVLLRCDLNVPLQNGKITDDKRIIASLPTIEYLLEKGAKVVITSHLGRPEGEYDEKFSLKPVKERLSELLKKDVMLAESKLVVDDSVRQKIAMMKDGDVLLLENVRFRKEETQNNKEFAKELSALADIFVNDAFGTAHRAHASTAGVAEFLPAVCGFLIEKELEFLGSHLDNPKKPFVAILGGAKVADKILLIEKLMEKADTLIIGGGMSYTFLKSKGYEIGESLLDSSSIDLARSILEKGEKQGVKIMLPVDIVVADRFAEDAKTMQVDADKIPADYMGLDMGQKTRELYAEEIKKAETVLWNGPMGVFEMETFSNGTKAIARAMQECKGTTIVGGGDSASAIAKFGMQEGLSHISTGGGASLEYLEGKALPGVSVLLDK